MVDGFLKAGDILAAQKEAHQGEGPCVEKESVNNICTQLKILSESASNAVQAEQANTTAGYKHISFFTALGESCDNLLEELSQYGQLQQQEEVVEGGSKWVLQLFACDIDNEDLFDSISFIAEPDSILIQDVQGAQQEHFAVPTKEDKTVSFDPVQDTSNDLQASFCATKNNVEITSSDSESINDTIAKVNKVSSKSEHSIRVNTEKVELLVNQVGELIITQSMLMQACKQLEPSEHTILYHRLAQLERNTRDLQESVMSIRMMPIGFVFGRFPRVVRDLAKKLNKKIELRLIGDETEIDKGVVEQLADPLMHLIRNSIDHGIETPAQRIREGKPEQGTITLSAFYEGGNVVINISDDGAGLDRNKILQKALHRGLDIPSNISDDEVYQLIFSAGLSTVEKVTELSGRGVGMDVVRRNIYDVGGQIDITSAIAIGTTISIRLPLTLAILDGMSVSVAGQVYIIPLTFISESFQPQASDIKTINGVGRVVKVREDYIPLVALHELFNIKTEITLASDGILVLLQSHHKKIALLVEQLEGQQQVVLKSLETNFHAVPYISGASIMGDGSLALILDVAGLINEID